MNKISVIVPCYGTEAYVENCLESLFNQTYKNLEIIAVNDCSKGNMQEILDNLKIKDSRLKVITNPVNKGLFHSRIIGSKEATGDYITFVDSDDYVDKDFFNKREGLKERVERDSRKRQLCKENGIELIYFLEPKFEKYETSGNLYFTDIDKLIEYINSKR